MVQREPTSNRHDVAVPRCLLGRISYNDVALAHGFLEKTVKTRSYYYVYYRLRLVAEGSLLSTGEYVSPGPWAPISLRRIISLPSTIQPFQASKPNWLVVPWRSDGHQASFPSVVMCARVDPKRGPGPTHQLKVDKGKDRIQPCFNDEDDNNDAHVVKFSWERGPSWKLNRPGPQKLDEEC